MSKSLLKQKATYTSMANSNKEDWDIATAHLKVYAEKLPARILKHLEILGEEEDGSMVVTRLEHSLQTATRAYRDGRDEEYVVCALLHDIGDTLGCYNHSDVAAAILKPFVSEENHWIVEQHGIFQGYYFFHHLGMDRHLRDQFKAHPYYQACVEFCANYDQNSFDPNYESMPLAAFEPMVHRLFATPQKTIYQAEQLLPETKSQTETAQPKTV